MSAPFRCDQCAACMIQGVFCHETGCPNTNSRLDAESGEWIKQRKCRECGCTVDADDLCCDAQDDEEETCSECGAALNDGEGYDGMCGDCADDDDPDSNYHACPVCGNSIHRDDFGECPNGCTADTDSLEDRGLSLGSYGS